MITNQGLGILLGLLPAVMLGGGALLCAAIALTRPRTRPSLYLCVTLLATAAAIAASLIELQAMKHSGNGVGLVTYGGALMVDRFHVFGTVLACSLLALAVLGSGAYMRRVPARAGAFCALLQVSTAAATLLLAQREMSAFAAAAALLSVSLVLLTAMTKTSGLTAEVAFRQVLSAGTALATALYGLALLYLATGSTDLSRLAAGAGPGGAPVDGVLAAVGIALVVIGITAVAGLPPLHAASRQVQGAAPGAIAGFGTALGALVGTGVLARFAVEGFGAGSTRWTLLVEALAAVAMLTGALLAMRAASLRELIAELGLAQAGFLLVAVAAAGRGSSGASTEGTTAFLFLVMAGTIALLAALLLAGMFDAAGLPPGIDGHRGLGRRAPVTAACLSLALLALAGLPPFAGFLGRLLAAEASLDAGSGWVAGVAGVSLVLSGIAVIRWLVAMYAEDSGEAPFAVSTTPAVSRAAAWSAAGLGLVLAAFAGPLIALAQGAATALH